MISYEFNKSEKILEVKFSGSISIDDMNGYILSLRNDLSLPSRLRILSDATEAKFAEKISKNDLISFLNENKKTLEQKDYVYDAFVISGTFETALGMIYKNLNNMKNYSFNIFSTREAAYNWLSLKGN